MPDSIGFTCAKCGSEKFLQPAEPKPDDMITCAGCGMQARFKDLQRAAIEQTEKAAYNVARDIFGKF